MKILGFIVWLLILVGPVGVFGDDRIRPDGRGGYYTDEGRYRSDGMGGFYTPDGGRLRSDGRGGFYQSDGMSIGEYWGYDRSLRDSPRIDDQGQRSRGGIDETEY